MGVIPVNCEAAYDSLRLSLLESVPVTVGQKWSGQTCQPTVCVPSPALSQVKQRAAQKLLAPAVR